MPPQKKDYGYKDFSLDWSPEIQGLVHRAGDLIRTRNIPMMRALYRGGKYNIGAIVAKVLEELARESKSLTVEDWQRYVDRYQRVEKQVGMVQSISFQPAEELRDLHTIGSAMEALQSKWPGLRLRAKGSAYRTLPLIVIALLRFIDVHQ